MNPSQSVFQDVLNKAVGLKSLNLSHCEGLGIKSSHLGSILTEKCPGLTFIDLSCISVS